MGIKKITILLSSLTLLFCFQHCSGANFGGGDSDTGVRTDLGNSDDSDLGITEGNGVDGGHFDLDTATAVYEAGKGDTNKHVHEYDDKHETNVVNFFDMIDKDFDEVDEVVPASQSFYIVVANGDLSPRVALEINGSSHPTSVSRHGPFSLTGQAGTQLNTFRALIATDAILNKGLVSTQTGCVVKNELTSDGRYRNGALTIQIIAANEINSLDPNTGVATTDSSLLWESTLFWHEDDGDCL